MIAGICEWVLFACWHNSEHYRNLCLRQYRFYRKKAWNEFQAFFL